MNPDIEIVGEYEESKSAKEPGRPVFGEMIRRIERGDAEGIVAWAPDRLARNSIDGGHLVYLLDRGVLRDLKFATYTFENNSQGKFMLNIMFGYSKYYSDNLSDVVKRGNRTKVERGWRPNAAPTGYLNDKNTKTIVPDPDRFHLVRRLFLSVLEGCSAREAATRARAAGFTTLGVRKGGGPLSTRGAHRILRNPFYAGVLLWNGQRHTGSHRPAVTWEEFEAVQTRLRRTLTAKPKQETFAYTGLITCGACGRGITAERKTNRYGYRYTYYHCTGRKPEALCPQRSLRLDRLEAQVLDFLRSLRLEPTVEKHLKRAIDAKERKADRGRQADVLALEARRTEVERQERELATLRVRGVLTDEDLIRERSRVAREREAIEVALRRAASPRTGIEPFEDAISFCNYAAKWYLRAENSLKRSIIEIAVSNLTLTDKILRFEAAKPFQLLADFGACLCLLGDIDGKSLPFPQSSIIVRLEQAFDGLIHKSTYLEMLHNAARDLIAMNANDVSDVPDITNAA